MLMGRKEVFAMLSIKSPGAIHWEVGGRGSPHRGTPFLQPFVFFLCYLKLAVRFCEAARSQDFAFVPSYLRGH